MKGKNKKKKKKSPTMVTKVSKVLKRTSVRSSIWRTRHPECIFRIFQQNFYEKVYEVEVDWTNIDYYIDLKEMRISQVRCYNEMIKLKKKPQMDKASRMAPDKSDDNFKKKIYEVVQVDKIELMNSPLATVVEMKQLKNSKKISEMEKDQNFFKKPQMVSNETNIGDNMNTQEMLKRFEETFKLKWKVFLDSSDGLHEIVQLIHEKNLAEGKSMPSDNRHYRFLRKCHQVKLKLDIVSQMEIENFRK